MRDDKQATLFSEEQLLKRALQAHMEKALAAMSSIKALQASISRDLVTARNRAQTEALPAGRVWQDSFVVLFKKLDNPFGVLEEVRDDVERLTLRVTRALAKFADQAKKLLTPPRKATIEHAISDIDFSPDAEGRQGITYSVEVLQEWREALEKWQTEASKGLERLALSLKKS